MTFRLVAPFMAASLLLAGCQSGHGGMRESPGGGGSAMGGTGKAGTAADGVLLGGLIGSEVGKSLDRADLAYMNQQTTRALESAPTNQTSTWQNPESQSQAEVTPTRTYQQPNGIYCREYSQAVTVKGQQQKASGTACRQPDGSWQAVSG